MLKEVAQFGGVVTRDSPAAPGWRDGTFSVAVNKRLAEDGLFRRRPGLSPYIAVPCPTAQAPLPILAFWHVRFDETSVQKDYIVAHVGDGDGDNDGLLYYWDLASLTTGAWTAVTNATGLSDTEPGTAFVYNGIFYYSDSKTQLGWGPDFSTAFAPGLAAPSSPSCSQIDNTGSRIQRGRYYYVITTHNKRRFIESMPSSAISATVLATFTKMVQATLSSGSSIYRTTRSSAEDFVSGDLSHFYFVGDTAAGITYFDDKRSDAEIRQQGRLSCRGGRPKVCRYMVLHQGRAWFAGFDYSTTGSGLAATYWDARCVEWSGAGRVEEVARQYGITLESVAQTQFPELTPGYFGEARTFLPDETGGGITGLMAADRVIVFTPRQAVAVWGAVEPFSVQVISRDVGLSSHQTLQPCGDYGWMGADAWGPWLYHGEFTHLGRQKLDLSAASETGVNTAQLSKSHGVWVRELKEYWWFVAPPGNTLRTRAIAYQAERGFFTGPYDFVLGGAEVTAGRTIILADATPVTALALSNGYIVKVDAGVMTDSNGTTARGVTTRSRAWFGAGGGRGLKRLISADLVFESITIDAKVTARLWAGDAVNMSPMFTQDHQDLSRSMADYPVGHIPPAGQGRFIAIDLVEPENVAAPLAWITLKVDEND